MRKSLISISNPLGKIILHKKVATAWNASHYMEFFLYVPTYTHVAHERRSFRDSIYVSAKVCAI